MFSWEEDRKFILRGWSFVFSILATLMVLTVVNGRMAYLQGSYTGYLGFWTNCRKYECPNLNQVTVLIHMSKGFMMLAMALCLVLLLSMGLSFRSVFRRLSKIDFVFSSLSIGIGLLVFLSLTLFVVNCQLLHPKPQVSYLVTFYLCLCASALMLWTGILSYLNQVGVWSRRMSCEGLPMSSRRWALPQSAQKLSSQQQSSDMNPEQTTARPVQATTQLGPQVPPRNNMEESQELTGDSR